MSTFSLTIISETSRLFSGKVSYCVAITMTGSIGFEARHEPFIGVLKQGSEIRYTDASGNENTVSIDEGLLTFKNNECTVVVNTA